MDALDHKDIVLSQLQKITLILPYALFEIIIRKFYPFSCHQSRHIPVKLLYIQAFNALIVIISLRIPWTVCPVYKIIVYRNGMGTQPGSLKLNRQTMGKGGLSRRGRACDHNKFRSFLLRDLRRDLRDLLFLKRLLN